MIERVRHTKHAHTIDRTRVISLQATLDTERLQAFRVAAPLVDGQHAVADPVNMCATAAREHDRGRLGIPGGLAKFEQRSQRFFSCLISRRFDVEIQPQSFKTSNVLTVAKGRRIAIFGRPHLLLHGQAKINVLYRRRSVLCRGDAPHEIDQGAGRLAAHRMVILNQRPVHVHYAGCPGFRPGHHARKEVRDGRSFPHLLMAL